MSERTSHFKSIILSNKGNVFFALVLLVIVFVEAKGLGDLDIFIQASRDLSLEKNIYQVQYHEWYHYYYDVLFALVISPLKALPLYWASVIWLLLNLFFSYRIWRIIRSYLPVDKINKKQYRILTVTTFAIISALWLKNMHLTQMTIFILYLCLEGIYRIEKKQFIVGSLLLAVGISIKVLPLVLIPYLLYRRYFKSAFLTIGFTVVLLFLPAIFVGIEYNSFLLHERWDLINPLKMEHVLDITERSFQSLTTFLAVYLTDANEDIHTMNLKRNIANLSLDTFNIIVNLVRLFFVGLTLYFLRTWPFKSSENRLKTFYELSYILLIIPLIFPHQQHYAFFFIFPAVSYLVFYYILRFSNQSEVQISVMKKSGLIFLFILIFFLLNSHMLLGTFRNLYDHFKTLTYGVLMIVPLLAFARPTNLEAILLKESDVTA